MNVKLKPETERRLAELATETGLATDDFLENMIEGYFEEAQALRAMIDSRYDDVVSGQAELIDGEEAFRRLKAKTQAERSLRK
jgi:predicted DNA-binding protein